MQDIVFLLAYIGFMCILTVVTVAIMDSLRAPRQNFYIATYGNSAAVDVDVEDEDEEEGSQYDDDDDLPDLEDIPDEEESSSETEETESNE